MVLESGVGNHRRGSVVDQHPAGNTLADIVFNDTIIDVRAGTLQPKCAVVVIIPLVVLVNPAIGDGVGIVRAIVTQGGTGETVKAAFLVIAAGNGKAINPCAGRAIGYKNNPSLHVPIDNGFIRGRSDS